MAARWTNSGKMVSLSFLSLFIAQCMSTPPVVQSLPASADTVTELAQTEEMIKDAQTRQIDVLSPENFTDAQAALEKAKKKHSAGKPKEDILEQLSLSRGWLKEAESKSELTMTAMKDLADARAGARRAGASSLFDNDFKKADKELMAITSEIERGNMKPAEKKGAEVTALYHDLEIQAVTKTHLGLAQDNLKSSMKIGAEKKAPRTLDLTKMKIQNVQRMIEADPRNDVAIRRGADDATRESAHLLEVMNKVNAGNTEDLVLTAERQQRTITHLRNEFATSEQELNASKQELSDVEKEKQMADRERQDLLRKQNELRKSEQLLQKAAQIRSQFKPQEAEVYAEDGKLKVRLKALQFPSGNASLGAQQAQLLGKVKTALTEVGAQKITIEGHTDSTGNPDNNLLLSEKRAAAVGNFFTSKGVLPNDKIKAVGKGSNEPISENSSAKGRSENRRIDMIIETE